MFKKLQKIIIDWERRNSIDDIPISSIYEDSISYWQSLGNLFPMVLPKMPPSVMKDNQNFWDPKREIFPEQSIEHFNIPIMESAACYIYDYNLICLVSPKIRKKELHQILAHEMTHAVLTVERSNIKIPLEELREFNGNMKNFGKILYKNAKNLFEMYGGSEDYVGLELIEFFPPIGQVGLFGEFEKYPWKKGCKLTGYLHKTMDYLFATEYLDSFIVHLPELAGELLITQYQNDCEALLREHPNLPLLDGKKLWDQYCRPILVDGKLK